VRCAWFVVLGSLCLVRCAWFAASQKPGLAPIGSRKQNRGKRPSAHENTTGLAPIGSRKHNRSSAHRVQGENRICS